MLQKYVKALNAAFINVLFYDDDISVGTCLFDYPPCDWDFKRIKEAIERKMKNDNNT